MNSDRIDEARRLTELGGMTDLGMGKIERTMHWAEANNHLLWTLIDALLPTEIWCADPAKRDDRSVSNHVEVAVEFTFEAAHWLPHVAEGHKCRQMHGHSYKLVTAVTGPVGGDGMVMDYAEIKTVVDPLIARIDHTCLNESFHSNPTCENLCMTIWRDLSNSLPGLAAVALHETPRAFCTYRGPR